MADQIAEFLHEIFERTFIEAVKNITADVCRTMGWAEKGGTTGNLSGKEGDMDELSMQVRQTLMDLEKKKEEKESGKALQEELNTNEMATLTKKIQKAAKRKREGTDDDGTSKISPCGSVSTLTSASPLTELEALDHFLANGRLPTSATLAAKPKDDNERTEGSSAEGSRRYDC